MTNTDEIPAAASVLLSSVGSAFGRISSNLKATSAQLAAACQRIQAAKTSHRTVQA